MNYEPFTSVLNFCVEIAAEKVYVCVPAPPQVRQRMVQPLPPTEEDGHPSHHHADSQQSLGVRFSCYINYTDTLCNSFLKCVQPFVELLSLQQTPHLILSPQDFNYATTEGGCHQRGDGAPLPRFDSPGVDRGTREARDGPSTEDN